ncbi:hypothetical protein FVEG_07169 [Fusarium verticillioides 7600]|uniref:Uncharacterized protein n=1 Tax=Gibberella moniliformis (strain M3125 / FGSC 7600) TaxID=334819 RepID=W7MH39_GIBM7|nr:hypothetical protein FVEG_07169 [Fusarium verticillioides 7600]EWG46884.1 hypothetical protein FVEG_07169 [Fusarium verticillioides 7600]
MSCRSLSLLGDPSSGKTLVGCLIYMCGLELSQLGEFERKGIHYGDILPFYEGRGQSLCFHAPSGVFRVEKSQTPDVAIWVVDSSDTLTWATSAQKLAAMLDSGELQPRERLIIAINKMDSVSWSEKTFNDAAHVFGVLNLNVGTFIIPVSASKGQNVLPDSSEPSWATGLSSRRSGVLGMVSSECLTSLLG